MTSFTPRRSFCNLTFLLFLSISSLAQTNDTGFDHQFENARFVFHRTYFEKASPMFDSLIRENPKHALTYAYAAMVDYMLFRDPSQHIEKAKELSKETNSSHKFTMALCSFAQGNLSDCEVNIKQYLAENPDDKYGLHVLGFTQTDLGRPQEALKTLSILTTSFPSYYPAYNHIGYAYLGLKQSENAAVAFADFFRSDPLNPSAFDSQAEVLSEKGEYNRAIASLSKAVLIEPNFAYGWAHLGDILVLNKERELAVLAYEMAKKHANLYGKDFTTSVNDKIKNLKE